MKTNITNFIGSVHYESLMEFWNNGKALIDYLYSNYTSMSPVYENLLYEIENGRDKIRIKGHRLVSFSKIYKLHHPLFHFKFIPLTSFLDDSLFKCDIAICWSWHDCQDFCIQRLGPTIEQRRFSIIDDIGNALEFYDRTKYANKFKLKQLQTKSLF